MDLEQELKRWTELKECYLEEVEFGNDVKMNNWLAENAQKHIEELEKEIEKK